MSQSCFHCSELRRPRSQKVPSRPEEHREPTDPEDMRLAVPVAPDKVLAPGRDWGSGREVGVKPGPASGGEEALEVSCVMGKDRQCWGYWLLTNSCPQQWPQPVTGCQGLSPKLHLPPQNPLVAPLLKNQTTTGALKLIFSILIFKTQLAFANCQMPAPGLRGSEETSCDGPTGGEGSLPSALTLTSESGLSDESSPDAEALLVGFERNQLNQPNPELWKGKQEV